MLNAIARIRRLLEDVALERVREDGDKRRLVERDIEIISEASRQLTDSSIQDDPCSSSLQAFQEQVSRPFLASSREGSTLSG